MICKKCYVGYCLTHPDPKFSRLWKKCSICGACYPVPDLRVVPND